MVYGSGVCRSPLGKNQHVDALNPASAASPRPTRRLEAPKDHINRRILPSDSNSQDRGTPDSMVLGP